MEYREAVEAAAIMLAIERAGDDELTALRSLIASSPGKENEETGLRDGGDFHVAPSRLSRNKFFADAMSGALTRLGRTRWLEVRTAESRAHARTEHLEIIAAVQSRDANWAAALVLSHS